MTDVDHDEETQTLRRRLAEAEDMLRAIRQGEIDALVIEGEGGRQVYTLHSAEEPYRLLVEQMHEGAAVLTGDGHILYCNIGFAALVGEPLETVVGSRIGRFVNMSDRDDFDRLLGRGSGKCRSSFIGSGSGTIEVGLSLTTTSWVGGERLNLIVTDLSELLSAKNNRDRAERANRSKDDFLATLAHELRTPIGAITNAVDAMALPDGGGEKTARSHRVIGRQIRHISHLVDDLLDVERVIAGKVRLHRQPLNLAENVQHIVATFASDVGKDREIDVITESVWAECDPVRFDQVVINLMSNAVKYTPPGGRILVTLHADAGDAVLTIEDTGFGIAARLLPFIFDMYVQADRTLESAQGGLGIGLTLVRRLVELHGGTVTGSSEGEGHGSTFTVRVKQIPPAEQNASDSGPRERRVRPRRVLLIEDSADAREMLRMMLELAGHIVYDAADGARGLELVNVVRPDVGIIDIGLPLMDGYEVAKRIREEPHGRRMLLLALSGYGASDDARRSSEHGFDYHLVKPVDPDRLTRLITEGLSAA
jgi:signal transduction histidine kinase/CheY-like chemotaxis protein